MSLVDYCHLLSVTCNTYIRLGDFGTTRLFRPLDFFLGVIFRPFVSSFGSSCEFLTSLFQRFLLLIAYVVLSFSDLIISIFFPDSNICFLAIVMCSRPSSSICSLSEGK